MTWKNILKNTYPQSTREQLLNLKIGRVGLPLGQLPELPPKDEIMAMSDTDFDVLLVKYFKEFIEDFIYLTKLERRQKQGFVLMENSQKNQFREAKEAIKVLKQLGLDGKLKQVANSMPPEKPPQIRDYLPPDFVNRYVKR